MKIEKFPSNHINTWLKESFTTYIQEENCIE